MGVVQFDGKYDNFIIAGPLLSVSRRTPALYHKAKPIDFQWATASRRLARQLIGQPWLQSMAPQAKIGNETVAILISIDIACSR